MQLKRFYKNIQNKKIKYFFSSKEIYNEVYKILKKLPSKKIKNILDLGCGDMKNFHIFQRLKFRSYTAIDWIDFKKKKLIKELSLKSSPYNQLN